MIDKYRQRQRKNRDSHEHVFKSWLGKEDRRVRAAGCWSRAVGAYTGIWVQSRAAISCVRGQSGRFAPP
jgi:hypothetical protein